MADLEKTIETPENTEGINPPTAWDDFNLDFSDTLSQTEPASPDLSDTPSEDLQNAVQSQAENVQIGDLPTNEQIEWKAEEVQSPAQDISTDNQVEVNLNSDSLEEKAPEVQPDVIESQTAWGNEVFLWKFDNESVDTTNQEFSQPNLEANIDVNTPILEWFKTPEWTWESEEAEQEHERQKLAQKEKLVQMIKTHETKAQKKWFTIGILSGIILTLWIVALCFVFAKEQILNFITDSTVSDTMLVDENNQEQSVDDLDLQDDEDVLENEDEIDNQEVLDEEVVDDESSDVNLIDIDIENLSAEGLEYYNQVNEIINEWLDTQTTVEQLNNILDQVMKLNDESNSELIQYISQSIMDMTVNYMDDINNQDYDDLDNSSIFNHSAADDVSNSDDKTYEITHVDTPDKANWVIPAQCSDLTCYGEDKEFSPCNKFKMDGNLTEDSQRILKNGACKYKDPSELVYVEFLNKENEKKLDNSTIDKKRARDVSRKTSLSQLQSAIVTSQWDKWIWPGMDKGANEWITINVIGKEIKEAWMSYIPVDPNIYNINYWLWNNYKNDSAMWEYLYLVAKRNWTQNGWFLLMAKTEVEWWSNWVVCKDWTWLNKWYIDNETDIAKMKLCTNITQWNSCGINDGTCTYTSEDELRYIVLY